ncbi:hypothetical protein K488DRAFT_83505 [Vararia minispora EC-137]|uniref:Uncharacterized protein n=1 Tax=Vararia minispora EC-137 TaxID=1314806 RepID=A0ACB8QTR6_9AGAM|nr:hypothetical protein K488DRAFT_83505 [Vararia minispora EC-137]
MSSDYGDDDFLDPTVLDQLDAIEATQRAAVPAKQSFVPAPAQPASRLGVPAPIDLTEDEFDALPGPNEDELRQLDAALGGKPGASKPPSRAPPQPAAGPSKPRSFARVPSIGGRQTTLTGGFLPEKSPQKSLVVSSNRQQLEPQPPRELGRKTKKWDQTAFSATGRRKKLGKVPPNPRSQPPPMKLEPDLLETSKWLYPTNVPKRDYQFNIAKHCLFDNTLVALPTGLGKTFIAGVVMLNYYRWFPTGKVMFVAPTKPLVAQQVEACHRMCGIPGRDAIDLTGEIQPKFRAVAKRVFYSTPQTLENDLVKGVVDARNIILLVVDEAHKAKGNYSYANVVRFLMSKNPHFRILALTATPSGNIEGVQDVVDSLHISRIELRSEKSLDIIQYIQKKNIEQHYIKASESIAQLRDLLSKTMQPMIQRLQNVGLVQGSPDPARFHPYRVTAAYQEIQRRRDGRSLRWVFGPLRNLQALAFAMAYLMEETVQMCYRSLKKSVEEPLKDGKPNFLGKDQNVQALMNELEKQSAAGFAVHPKMEKLKLLLVDHFGKRLPDNEGGGIDDIEEVVEYLEQDKPLLRPTRFIGQSEDKQGKKGMSQDKQQEIIRRFKAGEFNVMVATCVGEEGLDIGEVDVVVCYDTQSTPVRMLQRVGRTGRKREGYVHVLLAEGREEENWNKAVEKYERVQWQIANGFDLELYGDVERLLPADARPECLEMEMGIEPYDREKAMEQIKGTGGSTRKRKRNDDPARNIPPGTTSGFMTVAELIRKQSAAQKRRKTRKPIEFNEDAAEDDDMDEEIEAGLFAPRRTVSTPARIFSAKDKGKSRAKETKGKVQRSKSTAEASKKVPTKRRATKVATDYSASQFERQGADDSDDSSIERGLDLSPKSKETKPSRMLSPTSSNPSNNFSSSSLDIPLRRSSSPDVPLQQTRDNFVDLCTPSVGSSRSPSPPRLASSQPLPYRSPLVSPAKSSLQSRRTTTPSPHRFSKKSEDVSWLLAGSDDSPKVARTPARVSALAREKSIDITDSEPEGELMDVDDGDDDDAPSPIVPMSPVEAHSELPHSRDMPPPTTIPSRFAPPLEPSSPATPSASFPVRAGRTKKRPATAIASSSPQASLSPARKRVQHGRAPSPATSPSRPSAKARVKTKKKIRLHDAADAARRNPFLDVEAGHSADDMSAGSDDGVALELGSEGDLHFISEPGGTQVSPSYDQFAMYRQSLLSQAPRGNRAPTFAHGPVRRALFGRGGGRSAGCVSPSPVVRRVSGYDDSDEYELGSFIVDDDADITLKTSSET